jgi:hypothetical protein
MENPTSIDVRTVFLNTVLFGTNTVPEFKLHSKTSDLFVSLLKNHESNEIDEIFYEVSRKFLVDLNERERIDLLENISSNEIYNNFMTLFYMAENKEKGKNVEDYVREMLFKDVIEYVEKTVINDYVIIYFKIILDRIIFFDFEVTGMVSWDEYLRISSQILSNNMEKYFLE